MSTFYQLKLTVSLSHPYTQTPTHESTNTRIHTSTHTERESTCARLLARFQILPHLTHICFMYRQECFGANYKSNENMQISSLSIHHLQTLVGHCTKNLTHNRRDARAFFGSLLVYICTDKHLKTNTSFQEQILCSGSLRH